MVVAGGGGSGAQTGSCTASGGGGAGGYRASGYGPSPLQGSAQELGLGTYAVTVGAGGTAAPAVNNCGTNGQIQVLAQ